MRQYNCFIEQNTVLRILLILPLNSAVRADHKCIVAWLVNVFLYNLCIGLGGLGDCKGVILS